MIKIYNAVELNTDIRNKLNGFIDDEFSNIPIVKETEWASPNWTLIHFLNNEIASFYNIVEREIIIDRQIWKAAGINNVITPKGFRGKGLASKLLKETEGFMFDDLKSDIGLLLCADHLLPFYGRLNWYKIDCPVLYAQKKEKKLWQANTMLLTKDLLKPNEIDLNGLPW